jgi:hypothetical protein
MGSGRVCRQGRIVRLVATASLLGGLLAVSPGLAAQHVVSGTVGPSLGISVGADGTPVPGGTVAMSITVEQRGDATLTTLSPVG